MKPIGTITMYYPFVDGETRETLDSLMEKSEHFQDFIIRLGERVCSEDIPFSLAFIAAVWSRRGEVKETQERIAERYKGNAVILPWTFSSLSPTDGKALEAKMVEMLDEAIVSEPEDWILLHLLLRKMSVLFATPEGIWAFDAARNLLEKKPGLECFRPRIQHAKAQIKDYEGDTRSAIEIYFDVLERARQQDDQYLVANLLIDLGRKTSPTDYHGAMQFIDEAYSISKELGVPRLLRITLLSMSSISHKLGEYDLALKCLFNTSELTHSPSYLDYHIPLDVSDIYSDLGEGKEALSWALMYEEGENAGGPSGLSGHGCPEFAMARALLLLNRTEEALEHIERLRDIAFKTGIESWLAGHYFVSGLYEIATGEIATGMQMIQSALEIYERRDNQTFVNRCLIALTKAEIMSYEVDNSNLDPRDSGPWMARLEQEASDKRLFGILMQHAMLKAEFRIKLGQIDAARETLEAALDISDQPSVKTLRKRILEQIEALEKIPMS
ncbi:MAG: tetratricopeptide repeat protein [Candidatus Thorarchaeota archaeon]|jgi:tetratricopeptide (TPR) repeat protein